VTFDGVDELLDDSRSRLARVAAPAAYREVLAHQAVLVDIRPQAQREQEGEVHPDLAPLVIERNVLEWRLDPRHPSRLAVADFELRVILICQEGYASSLAADSLLRLGVHRSTDIIGGFAAWSAAGLPRSRPLR
jgi:rhodanese-related sulfurtransferase